MRAPRPARTLLALAWAMVLLSACSRPGVDRVDVEWATDPPPRWGLYAGSRQEIPFKKNSAYIVHVYVQDKEVAGGAVGDPGSGLAFRPSAGARDLEAEVVSPARLDLYATLHDKDGATRRVLALKVERQGDKIFFELPK